jgi:hypothetical protein
MFRTFLLLGLMGFLSACAPALNGYEMMPNSKVYDGLSSYLNKSVTLGNVAAEKGMGGSVAPVTSEQYKEALTLALRQAGWYSPEAGRYVLDARLFEVEQPLMGFNFTVTTKAEYTLKDKKTGRTKYNDILTLPCTVMFSEAFDGTIRLRKATACAVGENITHLLKVISQRN